ncbi:putative ribonuclease H-like domain-containing protein [Tanacetum coccineum]
MVAFLKKPEGSTRFHRIVDFLNSTHIKYALTENPTIYVSLIHQFWQTASASTSKNLEMEITATIDGRVKTVTETSIRRHLKLEDSDGISTLPNTEIFKQLALMGLIQKVKELEKTDKISQARRRSRVVISDDEEELEDPSKQGRNNLRNRSRIGINKWYQIFALRSFDLEVMEFESAHSNTTAKLPILKLGEYEMWVIRIKQYFQIQDYALWEVIENGDSWLFVPQTAQGNGTSVTKMFVPVTAEEKTNKKNDVKARSLLLMALPNEHQLTFCQYTDTKTMFAAIETRFRGNEATKKTQKTLLNQQYENFSASSSESLDSIFNRIQKIVSRLAILGVAISQEDLNSNFLNSLPPKWNTHVVVWMNKAEIETMSIDDLYNNFKIFKQSVKKYVGVSSGAQNLAFMFAPSTSSTNDVNTAIPAYEVSTSSPNVNTASPQVSTARLSDNDVYAFMVENPNGSNLLQKELEQIHKHDLEAMDLKCQLSLLSMRAKRYYQRTCKKIFLNANDTAGYDKSKSDMAEEQVQINIDLMAFLDSEVYTDKTSSKTCLKNYETPKKQCDDLIVKLNQTKFIAATYKRGLATVEEQLITYRKNEVLFSEEVAVLKREVACKDYEINMLKSEFEKVKQEKEGIEFKNEKFDKASKDRDNLLGSQITNKSKKGLGYNAVPPPHPLIYKRPKKLDLSYSGLNEFKEPKFNAYGFEVKQVSKDTSSFVESSLNVDKETVFLVDKKINYNHYQRKRIVSRNNYNRVDYDYYAKTTHPSVYRNITLRAVLLKTGLIPLNTVRPVNTAHPKPAVHSAKSMTHFSKQAQSIAQRPFYKQTALTRIYVHTSMRHYHTKRSRACNTTRSYTGPVNAVRAKGGKPQQNDTGFVNSRCSRYMTGNIAYLSDFKEFDRGYGTFGGGAHGGRIYGKGTLKTDSLDFEDVYFVNELKFNLFSVSQMCDKKNYVLFTDTECLVLSPNFKLPDENQILFKIPRKDNMYSFDMKNIVSKESLTCLIAKATLDESMLWHRRLGHINFKNINKLVKDNLVRGLPTKRFENDQTCVACLKGKQHRASCKSKVLNPITKPLFMLHMDLFGPTFVNSLMHKKYCLVVTDDYSRCDNGTKYTNKVMDDFCIEKGIKREYSVARTPQQNGMAERRNRTLIEAARTMLADSKLPTTFWVEAVSTSFYVQNKVLIVKPHNKKPYKLFRGFKPALSVMKLFRCHVIILSTLDILGKFDGKSDEENKPMIEGNGPKWLFDIDSLTQSMNYVLVAAGTIINESADASYFNLLSKDVDNGEPKSVADDQKQVEDGLDNENDAKDKSDDDSSPKEVNAVG